MKYSVEELTAKKEDQTYDRKSARKEPKGLSNHIVAFANTDGGMLVIGIEDDGKITCARFTFPVIRKSRHSCMSMIMCRNLEKALTGCIRRWRRQDCRHLNIRMSLLCCMRQSGTASMS